MKNMLRKEEWGKEERVGASMVEKESRRMGGTQVWEETWVLGIQVTSTGPPREHVLLRILLYLEYSRKLYNFLSLIYKILNI